ncbi:hypothetical protein MBLNU230_g1619t1 [Neophaeotheca triangularis]
MSSVNAAEASGKSASKKKNKKSKKKANGKAKEGAGQEHINGVANQAQDDGDDDDDGDDAGEQQQPLSRANSVKHQEQDTSNEPSATPSEPTTAATDEQPPSQDPPSSNGAQYSSSDIVKEETGGDNNLEAQLEDAAAPTANLDAETRFAALQTERDNLRSEVTSLRKSLESLQAASSNSNDAADQDQNESKSDSEELNNLREELEQTQQGKEHAETQYRNLLGKVNTIRSQLGERLKQDAEELAQARQQIEELEGDKTQTGQENERLQARMEELDSQIKSQNAELEDLRSRTHLSTSNWAKERDDMLSREAFVREEYEAAKQAMQDWEILATEERSRRENLEERAQELEEQLTSQTTLYERLRGEAETQNSTVEGLQRALRDLQEERKRELREMVEQSQSQLEELRSQAKTAETRTTDLQTQLSSTQKDLERALPFEREVKEKNLLIGKLRHEAVILNDHLTKALRFLKRGKPEDNVDRQLVTNHFLHFLALDRSDPKKFQVLQLIAALLAWNEQQREQAGLLRQGSGVGGLSAGGSLRLPVSPFRRSGSTPALNDLTAPPDSPGGKETLAELWSDFLEREAEAGGGGGGDSRRGSVVQGSQSAKGSPVVGNARAASPEVRRKESQGQGQNIGAAGGGGG